MTFETFIKILMSNIMQNVLLITIMYHDLTHKMLFHQIFSFVAVGYVTFKSAHQQFVTEN